jgi:DNA-binding NarL/FixJ family response regulator
MKRRQTVLLIDNFKPFRQWVRSKLKSQKGFRLVGEASDAVEGLETFQELIPDLTLLTIELPNLNGIVVQEQICRILPSAKILLLTVRRDEEVIEYAVKRGAKACLVKSDMERHLVAAMEAVLRGERFLSTDFDPDGEEPPRSLWARPLQPMTSDNSHKRNAESIICSS